MLRIVDIFTPSLYSILVNTFLSSERIIKMKDLTKGNIYKTFFTFGLPLVLSGLFSQLYQKIDTAIAGKFLGDEGLERPRP